MLSLVSPASPVPPHHHGESVETIDFRQLRHHTKNALQRILCQIAKSQALQSTPDGRKLMGDLERRIHLSSSISDALFGLTRSPGPLCDRLQVLCDSLIELLGDDDQLLRAVVIVDPATPPDMDELVLRIVNELVGNAVKHGMYARSAGTITVQVERSGTGQVHLQVLDDGWGFRCAPEQGEGLRMAELLAGSCGGTVTLGCRRGLTLAEATLHPV